MEALFTAADCGPSNSLSTFSKEMDRDRSMYQDRFEGPSSSTNAFLPGRRRQMQGSVRDQEMAEEFFREEAAIAINGFDMRGMAHELSQMGPMQHASGSGTDWASDFLTQAGPPSAVMDDRHFSEMDAVFRREEESMMVSGPMNGWTEEFQAFRGDQFHPDVIKPTDVEFEKAFQEASDATWAQEFDKQENQWANEFNRGEENAGSWADEFEKVQKEVDISGDSKEALSKTAGLLLDIVENASNPKFKSSKFLSFMKQIRDQELSIEGNKVVEAVKPVNGAASALDWAQEFNPSVTTQSWEEEFMLESGPSQKPVDFATEFQQQQLNNSRSGELEWAEQFKQSEGLVQRDLEDEAMENAFQSYMNPQLRKEEARALDWETDWANIKPTTHQFSYTFIPDNPYLSKPASVLQNMISHENLAESILALEALVQINSKDAGAWQSLGFRQQENENESQAIAALKNAVNEDPSLLESWNGLAVSYTNEGMMTDAYDALESWLRNSEKYRPLLDRAGNQTGDRHGFLTEIFMQAARANAGMDLDPTVQMALGVLFNISQEYSKAVDCFEASLSKQPEDYMLWNKLGATLANSRSHERALDAYFNALQLNPAFIRARYNLSVSCIQLGTYKEAAEHLLAALAIQERNFNGALESDGSSVDKASMMRNSMGLFSVQRRDLLEAVERRDLSQFKGDFDF
ncbi:Peroxisomal membrane signal receptor PTS1 [Dinochytrium kinnereticum]|nr:Peroxisomal membrane signal receptor PTS1 [Dinochytrium kinnereticum]